LLHRAHISWHGLLHACCFGINLLTFSFSRPLSQLRKMPCPQWTPRTVSQEDVSFIYVFLYLNFYDHYVSCLPEAFKITTEDVSGIMNRCLGTLELGFHVLVRLLCRWPTKYKSLDRGLVHGTSRTRSRQSTCIFYFDVSHCVPSPRSAWISQHWRPSETTSTYPRYDNWFAQLDSHDLDHEGSL